MQRSGQLPRVGAKIRHAFGLYAREMLKVFDGAPRPEKTNADGVSAWETANNNIYSILFFLAEDSASITVRLHESTEQGRFDGNTKEARRACREKLFSSAIRAGSDPTDFIAKVESRGHGGGNSRSYVR